MKKKIIVAILIILLAAVAVCVAVIIKNANENAADTAVTTIKQPEAQLDVTVDSWLKIIKIDEEYENLAVVVENVSDEDIEYAVLSVKVKEETLTFNVSALLSGTRAVLLCNEAVDYSSDEVYTGWQIKDKITYKTPPVMNDNVFEVVVLQGSISIKNISDKDIESDIYIYYKDKNGDVLNGSVTYRTHVSGLKAGAQTFIKAEEFNNDNCQVIFTDYDDKEI